MITFTTRRKFLSNASLALSGLAIRRSTSAQQPADVVASMRDAGSTAKIQIQPLRSNISVLLGSGGNIAVLTAQEGKLLVDSGFATSQPQIEQALASLSGAPIRQLINTHWHFDHTDGNEWMHASGGTITAHTNTLKRLSTTQHIAAFGATFPPSPSGALPKITFDQEKTLSAFKRKIALQHYDPAHTDSDISVHFEDADVLHTGDTWFNGIYPFIDYSTGGNIDGMIVAARRNLATVSASTIIVPGHGPVGNKIQLARYVEMLTGVRDTVSEGKKRGKDLNQIIAEKPTAPFDNDFSPAAVPIPFFLQLVFSGV